MSGLHSKAGNDFCYTNTVAMSIAPSEPTIMIPGGAVKAVRNGRESMEDAFTAAIIGKHETLYIVCDGHGGADVANETIKSLPDVFKAVDERLDVCLRLKEAFLRADEGLTDVASSQGTTVVACLVDAEHVSVAHVGDSRAVLCRAGHHAVALTHDHNTRNDDEVKRIRDMGGFVFKHGQCLRVFGTLMTTRGLGDRELRPYVTADPDVCCVKRQANDEFLIIATDGLWDVMENDEAARLARKCIAKAHERGMDRQAAMRIAATVLTRAAAIERGSKDNITVMLVDLLKPVDVGAPCRRFLPALDVPCPLVRTQSS